MAKLSQWQDDDFQPARRAAARATPPRIITLLASCIGLLFLCAVLWAHFSSLDEVTIGEGKVISSRKMQVVQNLEGGILKDVMVSEGDVVSPEQVLLRIDDTGVAANYGESRVKALNQLAAISRLTAEVEGTPLNFPRELLAERPDFADSERANYLARQNGQKAEVATLRQQLTQRESELLELRSKVQKLDRSNKLLQEELATTTPLVETGAIARVEVLRLERQANEMKGDLDSTRLAIPRAEAAIQEINRKIEERQSVFRADAAKELAARRAEFATVRETISAAKDRVERTEVRSPVRGIVQSVKIRTVGGVIRPGMDLIEIVPLDDTLLVEAKIKPSDIAFIRPGLPATVKLSAYDFSIYGGLTGKVERISADSILEERSQSQESFYLIQVRTDSTQLSGKGQNLPIIPGMVATVDVLTGKKTVLQYLLKPFLKTGERALRER